MKTKKVTGFIIIFLLIILFLVYVFKVAKHYPEKIDLNISSDSLGVTYSKKRAKNLGLDWKEAYLNILDDLGVKKIRIPVHWDEIEMEKDQFDFSDYDFLIKEGEKRDVEFILNIGARTARWPECHFPDWIDSSDSEFLEERIKIMLEKTIYHFKDFSSIAYWQLENESLLNSFGLCPRASYDFLQEELLLLRSLDNRPVIISATGELSLWKRESQIADVFGTTMYRVVHNKFLGYLKYPYTSEFYSKKAKMNKLDFNRVFIIELQAEPWLNFEKILDPNDKSYLKSASLDQIKANIQVAQNTKFSRIYLWGVEWWYLRHSVMNDSSYWDLAKNLFR